MCDFIIADALFESSSRLWLKVSAPPNVDCLTINVLCDTSVAERPNHSSSVCEGSPLYSPGFGPWLSRSWPAKFAVKKFYYVWLFSAMLLLVSISCPVARSPLFTGFEVCLSTPPISPLIWCCSSTVRPLKRLDMLYPPSVCSAKDSCILKDLPPTVWPWAIFIDSPNLTF